MLIWCALKQRKDVFAFHLLLLNFYLVFNLYNARYIIGT